MNEEKTMKMVFLLVFLTFLVSSVWAEEKKLPTKLPTIVVRGEDRSYLEIIRTKRPAHMTLKGEKKAFLPYLKSRLMERAPLFPSYPFLEEGPLRKFAPKRERKVPPLPLTYPQLSTSYGAYERIIPEGHAPLAGFIHMTLKGEKELSRPPSELPLREEEVPITSKEEKPYLPYMALSASSGLSGEFSYRLDYGRKEGGNMYFFTLNRDFTSQQSKYENKPLAKDTDGARVEVGGDLSKERGFFLALEGRREKIDLPEERENNKSNLEIKGDWKFVRKKNIFKLGGWVERMEMECLDQRWEGTGYGTQIEVEMRGTPLSFGIDADWENLSDGDSLEYKSQSHLWIKDKAIFPGVKNLSITARVGFKGVGGQGEFLPYVKAIYQASPQLQLEVVGKKDFYFSRFSELYLRRDYVKVKSDLKPSKVWNYKVSLKYEASSQMDIFLEWHHEEGEEVIWNWDEADSLAVPDNANLRLQGIKLRAINRSNENFEQEFIYTHQRAENLQDSSKVVPYHPQDLGKILLRWTRDDWQLEAEGEIIGERYYQEDINETLPSGTRGKLKVSKTIGKRIKGFVQLELNDYELWKNYRLPEDKFTIGIEAQL